MRTNEVHCVTHVGKQVPASDDTVFNPETFDAAIHGLEELLIELTYDVSYDTPGESPHTVTETDDGKQITVADDTMLKYVLSAIPAGWDVSVVTDKIKEHGWGVRASVDCGGGVIVAATVILLDGELFKLRVGYTDLGDTETFHETTDVDRFTSSHELVHIIHWLQNAIKIGYKSVVASVPKTFDYTVLASPRYGDGRHPTNRQINNLGVESDWGTYATVRGVSEDTVQGNFRDVQSQLHSADNSSAFDESGPALIELPEDDDNPGDIRLV